MKVRVFSLTKRHDGYINGNACNPKDWKLASYRNDVFEVADGLDDAALSLQVSSLTEKDRTIALYVVETNPAEAREVLSERVPYKLRTKALRLWCMGAFELSNELRTLESKIE